MKQQKTLYLIGFLAVSLVACKQEFLDITPLVGSTEANYYLTPEDAEEATIACNNNLQQEVTNILSAQIPLTSAFRRYLL